MKKRPIFKEIFKRMKEPRKFMQVLLRPRQIGKTTLAIQIKDALKIESFYISADTGTLQDIVWLETQWKIVREKIRKKPGLLIIDESELLAPKGSELQVKQP